MDLFSLTVADGQPDFLECLFKAYYDCRKNKRNTIDALAFELNLESNLFELYDELRSGTYTPGPCTAFIVNRPVKREVFAAQFRDRVVHHFIINRLNPHFESLFLPESFACRVGKGTSYGIDWIKRSIREARHTSPSDIHVLKLDVSAFFMSIDRGLLKRRLIAELERWIPTNERWFWTDLVLKIVQKDPTQDCHIRGSRSDWDSLPLHKSLFHSGEGKGLPIGNLTSQIFANMYLHPLDQFVRSTLGFEFYGRYVDDFVILDADKHRLCRAVRQIETFLIEELKLTLHPNKRYLQPISRGVPFLGVVIYPDHVRVGKRIRQNFRKALLRLNETMPDVSVFQASVNSYLGLLSGFPSYRFRKKTIQRHSDSIWLKKGWFDSGYHRYQLLKK